MPAKPATQSLTKNELAAKIAALRDRQDWHQELLAQLQDGRKAGVGIAGHAMPTAHGTIVGYNAQLAVDASTS